MGMLLHRHLEEKGVVKKATPKEEKVKLNNEFKEKDKANDNKRKNYNGKDISK